MYICKLKILFYNVLDDSIGREEAQLAMRKAGKLLQSFHFAWNNPGLLSKTPVAALY